MVANRNICVAGVHHRKRVVIVTVIVMMVMMVMVKVVSVMMVRTTATMTLKMIAMVEREAKRLVIGKVATSTKSVMMMMLNFTSHKLAWPFRGWSSPTCTCPGGCCLATTSGLVPREACI